MQLSQALVSGIVIAHAQTMNCFASELKISSCRINKLTAIFGWSDIKQAERHTRAADQKRLTGSSTHLIRASPGMAPSPS